MTNRADASAVSRGTSVLVVALALIRDIGKESQRIPDYFTEGEAVALVYSAPSYPTRMAFRSSSIG